MEPGDGAQLIDEFTDVNADEKALMKLWNQHVQSYTVIPDRLMAQCCREFSARFCSAILNRRLRNNYAMHLVNLYNFGLVSPDDIRACLQIIDDGTQPPSANATSGGSFYGA